MSAALRIVAGAPAAAFPIQGFVAVNDNKAPDPNSNAMAILLGELRGEMRGLRDDVAEVKDALADASTSRGQLSEKVSLTNTRLEKLEGIVTVMGGVVDKQTNRIDRIEPWILRLAAVGAGLALLGGAVWYGMLNYGAQLIHWLYAIMPPPK